MEQTNKLMWILVSKLRSHNNMSESCIKSIVVLYVSYLAKINIENPLLGFDVRKALKFERDVELKEYINYKLENLDTTIINDVIKYSVDEIKEAILHFDLSNLSLNESAMGDVTPDGIIKLVNKLLEIKDNEVIGDIGAGYGNYSLKTSNDHKNNDYYQYEILIDNTFISKIKYSILKSYPNNENVNFNIENVDVFNRKSQVKFDKAFMHMPFRMRNNEIKDFEKIKKSIPLFSNIKKSSNLDWPFIVNMLDSLKEYGRGVSLTVTGTAYNFPETELRKFFVDNKFLQGIILLPQRLLNHTNIPSLLYVIGKNETKNIKMVDASDIFTEGRRDNFLSNENIDKIYYSFNNETSISRKVTFNEIEENDYNLLPTRYINVKTYINGTKLKDILTIQRGAPLTAKELDEISTQRVTDYQYLMLADVSDGLINEDLNYIKSIDEKNKKYVIEESDIVLSKIGSSFKVAVMDKRETEVVANGNLYILKLDKSKVNPYYLQAFLQSDEGQELLLSRSTGVAFSSIGVKDLYDLEIPLPSLEKQGDIGKILKQALKDLRDYTIKLEKTKYKIKNAYHNRKD